MNKILDMHCHIYPEKISKKATEAIGKFYNINMYFDTAETDRLIQALDEAGIEKALVCSAATTPAQVESINDFIAASVNKYPDRFIGFGTLHADYENIGKEVERMQKLGLKGIKLHPDFQKFAINGKKTMAIYEAAEGVMPVLFHMGDNRYEFSSPYMLADVLHRYQNLKVIGAHFAGYSQWDDAVKYLADFDIMIDTSSTLPMISAQKARELKEIWGVDRMMFGSDFPMWNQAEELERVKVLGFESEEDKEKYYYLNGARLLGLEK